ncbi:F0F1 ATP synthase subunit B [Roseospirillum parvum]|uniref:ATP synthase subunit b n=1 Tax=Roseospirillum parvum TaxID=83401 RepID=A0A1G7UET2_9PROT|nr:F0F1 ATP synthase subunit B [Roseospirillum parvum]SDG45994.1 F-type H+-transporting ATPase subunit b [Roseospirillum parvum]
MIATALAASHAEDAAHAASGGLFADPAFWVGLAFLVVVAAAFRPAFRAITTSLDTRAAGIKSRLEEARKLREDAQAMLAEYQRKQKEALKEAEDILAQARGEAERLHQKGLQQLEESITRREQQAQERIAQAEAQAVREVRTQAVDVALAAAAKVIAERLDANQSATLIDAAIKDLPQRLH